MEYAPPQEQGKLPAEDAHVFVQRQRDVLLQGGCWSDLLSKLLPRPEMRTIKFHHRLSGPRQHTMTTPVESRHQGASTTKQAPQLPLRGSTEAPMALSSKQDKRLHKAGCCVHRARCRFPSGQRTDQTLLACKRGLGLGRDPTSHGLSSHAPTCVTQQQPRAGAQVVSAFSSTARVDL